MKLLGTEINRTLKDAHFTRQINKFVTEWGDFENFEKLQKEANKRNIVISYEKYTGNEDSELIAYVYELGKIKDIKKIKKFIANNNFEVYHETDTAILVSHSNIQNLKNKVFAFGGSIENAKIARLNKYE